MSGGVQEPPTTGMITLDDLDNMTDELGSDSAYNSNGSVEEEAEPMEDGDQDRLLNYWQTVARGHQVEVPNGKTHSTNLSGFDIAILNISTQ